MSNFGLDRSSKQRFHKSFGAKSSLSSSKRVSRPLLQQDSTNSYRQHNSGCLYQQRRGDKVGLPVCPTVENPVLVYQETGNSQGMSYPRQLNVIADKLSRLGQTIQTEWSLHPEAFQAICSQWHQPKVDLFATRFNNKLPVCVTSPRPPGMGSGCTQPVLGGPGPICLPTSSHLGQSGGKVARLPMQQNHTDCTGMAQHSLVLILVAMSSQIPLCLPSLPNLVSQPFNQVLHRNLSNLNLHAWLLEPQQSRSRASLRQWQYELRLLKEDQPDPSMRRSGPFLQSGASVIRWTSGHHL